MYCIHCMFYIDIILLKFRFFYNKFNYKVCCSDSTGIGKKTAIRSVCVWNEDVTQDLHTHKPFCHVSPVSLYAL